MKKTRQYLMVLCTVLLTSCNLFIDEDLENQLIEYSGRGYDEIVSDSTDNYSVTYQYKKTTMELNADNPLTQHIVRVETIDSAQCHYIHFDSATPKDMLPKVGQHIVSNNIDLFPLGLCALVGIVEKEGSEWVVTCKSTDVKDAFEYLKFHATMPAGDYFDEYDIYDEGGNFLAHIDNREKHATARANTRGEEGDDYLNLDVDIGIPDVQENELDEWKDKYFPENFSFSITGNIKGKLYADCDFDWDNGLNISFKLKEGAFTVKITLECSTGMSSMKKLFGNDDLLNGKVRITVGPVVVVPVFGFSVHYQIYGSLKAEFTYTKPLDFEVGFTNGDFSAKNNSGKSSTNLSFEAACNVDCPIVKLSLGFGLFSSDLSIRAEIYAKVATQVGVSMDFRNFGSEGGEPANSDFNPKFTMDFQLGIAVALVAKGMIISKVLNKIKKHVKERTSHVKAVTNYFKNGSYADWVALKKGEYVNPETLAEMEKILGNKTGQDREDLIDAWIKSKAKENSSIKDLSNDAMDTEMNGHVIKPGEAEDDKEFSLRLGPFYPDLLKWNITTKYMFPKMKEGSFKVGQKWTAPNEPIVFIAEWAVEDPGIICNFKTLYPCFTVLSGSDEIYRLFVEEEYNAELTGDTPKGRIYSVEIPELLADEVYTCIPGYANEFGGPPVVQDKGLSFATITPTISIVKLVETGQELVEEKVGPVVVARTHRFHFDTYSNVAGTMNIQEWGILDNNDKSSSKKHTSKNAKQLNSGNYIHHWTVGTLSNISKVTVKLSPYIFGRDATDLNDMSQAKVFPEFKKRLKWDYDFTDGSRGVTRTVEKVGDDVSEDELNYTLKLDSVTYNGVRIM